jgi:peptidoglycan/LPS O-acetylase OafA/YrhL
MTRFRGAADRVRLDVRNRYLDLLRALAIVRVVVYHVAGWAWLTIVFPAMGVMFALGGSLMAASLDRYGVRAVGRRLRRLLPPLWIQAALFVPAMLLTGLALDWRLAFWVLPVYDPPANGWGALALSVIWYLRDYLWFALVSPLALPLFRRWPLPTLIAPFVVLGASELWGPFHPVVPHVALYLGCWLLGFAHHDGLLRSLGVRLLVPLAAGLAALGAAWFVTHPGWRGYDLNDIPLGNALWSAAFILVALGLAPASVEWLDRRAAVSRTVTLLNQRALTIYLWHQPIVIGLGTGVALLGWSARNPLALRLAVVAGFVALAVIAFGWVEDVAARRAPTLLPPRPAWSGRRDRDVAAVGAQVQQVRTARPVRHLDVHVARAGLRVDLVVAGRHPQLDVARAGLDAYPSWGR